MSLRKLFPLVSAITLIACSQANELEAINKIRENAQASHPNDLVAADAEVNQAVEQRVKDRGIADTRPKEVAALTFLGYYTKNAFAIPSVCSENGIAMVAFPEAFKDGHRSLLASSSKLLDSAAAIERAKSIAVVGGRQELARFAQDQATDVKGACKFIEDNAAGMAKGAHFSKVMPSLSAQLEIGHAVAPVSPPVPSNPAVHTDLARKAAQGR